MQIYIITYYPSVVYYYIYFHAIKNITIGTVKRKTDETSDDDFLHPLNIFCLDKWLASLINWVQYAILK